MHSEWDVDLPTEAQIDLDTIGSELRQTLFKIALKNLQWVQKLSKNDGFDKFRCLPFKDALNLEFIFTDANNRFGEELTAVAKAICVMPQLEEHPTQIDHIVTSLKANSSGTAKGLLDQTYELQKLQSPDSEAMRFITMIQNIILFLCSALHILRPLVGSNHPSEADCLYFWMKVIEAALPLGTRLRFQL
ncbi:hypothetical protein BGZ65_007918 [Modicella reniformis]|uniref:Uncharacterized protein n=1 Tax=Modicella reniformis TaxID=1440133 RepID=A0A9P6JGX7_9FUNG|nr:hypothetical protein BGZ65_007918 [Modicella reniformis]